jgi:ribokinase
MPVLNYGSLNIDHVYRVRELVAPGETLSCISLKRFCGGKGANQSAALARAGAQVFHAGKIGADGSLVLHELASLGANTKNVRKTDGPTGHAIIQVDDAGENAIVIYPGGNHEITEQEIDETLAHFGGDSTLLLQNEINNIPYLMQTAHDRGLAI